jgi:hypothetical protein
MNAKTSTSTRISTFGKPGVRASPATGLAVLALTAACAMPAAAQQVYRCGSSYSQEPCPGAKELPAGEQPTAQQRLQAIDVARRDAALADNLEQARLREEARVANLQPWLPPAQPVVDTPRRPAQPEIFRAYGPGERKSKARTKAPRKRVVETATTRKAASSR